MGWQAHSIGQNWFRFCGADCWGLTCPLVTSRHLMPRGAPMWEAAGFLGMSEKTLRDTYGHHHPDHLRGAADAIGSRPTPKKVALVVSLVEEKAKRLGVLETPEIIGGPGRTRTSNQTVMSGRL
jgi:hypothetical protein